MTRPNYFQLLKPYNLSFDPPETDQKLIKRAIDDWLEQVQKQEGSTSDEKEKREIRALKSLHSDMEATLLNTSSRKAEAEQYKQAVLEDLGKVIKLYNHLDNENRRVAMTRVRALAGVFRLQPGTVKNEFEKDGYKVVVVQATNVKDILGGNNGEIDTKLQAFRDISESRVKGGGKVFTLFELLAVLDGNPAEQSAAYISQSNEWLTDKINGHSAKYHLDYTEYGFVVRSLLSLGKLCVFNSMENRGKYLLSIKCLSNRELLDAIRLSPYELKQHPDYQAKCVGLIMDSITPDRDAALALYRHFAAIRELVVEG